MTPQELKPLLPCLRCKGPLVIYPVADPNGRDKEWKWCCRACNMGAAYPFTKFEDCEADATRRPVSPPAGEGEVDGILADLDTHSKFPEVTTFPIEKAQRLASALRKARGEVAKLEVMAGVRGPDGLNPMRTAPQDGRVIYLVPNDESAKHVAEGLYFWSSDEWRSLFAGHGVADGRCFKGWKHEATAEEIAEVTGKYPDLKLRKFRPPEALGEHAAPPDTGKGD